MPNLEKDLVEVARKELHIFYILDTSGSMQGTPIAKLNKAMGETVDALRGVAKKNADALLKIAVLSFNSGCDWINRNGPEELEDFMWEELTAGGLTDVGAALKELDSKLSRKAFLNSMTGAYLPVIIFMTDGQATDDYKKALAEIRQNKWFHRATKIGFAIGDNVDEKMISEVVGNSEAVIHTDNLDTFVRLIKTVSVTASMLASQSKTSTTDTSAKDIIDQVIGDDDNMNSDISVDVSSYNQEDSDDGSDDGWGDDWD